jgi:tetratricopeptide (TPR) repeat protein
MRIYLGVLAAAIACTTPRPAPNAAERAAPDAARSAFERGKQLALRGDTLRAEQYLATALSAGYAEDQTLRWLIGVCVKGSRLRAAIHYAEPYLEAHPEALSLRYVVATLFFGIGQSLRAREHLLEIVARAPDWAEAHYLLGVVESEGFADSARASEHFQAYLERAPAGSHAPSAAAWLARHSGPPRSAP